MTLLFILPFAMALLCFVLPRQARYLAVAGVVPGLFAALHAAFELRHAGPLLQHLGGWAPPLGIMLYIDGLSALLLVLTAVVMSMVSVYSFGYFKPDAAASSEHRAQGRAFWPLLFMLWGGLNVIFASRDIFNLYVTLELITLSAVALTAINARALQPALIYLFAGLLGSMLFLLGVGLLYAHYHTLDMGLLQQALQNDHIGVMAFALIIASLLLKAALFPFHFWLPPAHGHALAPVSALLSGLVVKAAMYVILRLWFEPFDALDTRLAAQLLGVLGAVAIFWGGWCALRAERLKSVAAYSTVSQLGYFFILFPLSADGPSMAWYAAIWLLIAHGLAKPVLFLAAGSIRHQFGLENVSQLKGLAQKLPLTAIALSIAAIGLIGLPPGAGFPGKWLLLNSALHDGAWVWALIIALGTLLSAAYLFRILGYCFMRPDNSPATRRAGLVWMEWSAIGLALLIVVLGVMPLPWFELLAIGAPLEGPRLLDPAPEFKP